MFGYVAAELSALTKEQTARYNAVYCGICRALHSEYGNIGRLTLTYDAAFFVLLLSSAMNEPYTETTGKCLMHPLRARGRLTNRFTAYAADMNLILVYEKLRDDVLDDGSRAAESASRLLLTRCESVRSRYPRQSAAIDAALEALHRVERENVLQPDVPANIFGAMVAELLVYDEVCPKAAELRRFGRAIGRFVYLMDAELDLPSDLRKGNYNPLVGLVGVTGGQVLEALSNELHDSFEALGAETDRELLLNIMERGSWLRYNARELRRK